MSNKWGDNVNSERLYFEGLKITADGDCSHEIKRHLLIGRKVMSNLDSILKSRDITLPTKVHLVKAMVFPVVMCGYESWTIKKTEHQRFKSINPSAFSIIYGTTLISTHDYWKNHSFDYMDLCQQSDISAS